MHRIACRMPGLWWVLILLSVTANAQTVKLHVSSKAGDRLTARPDAQFSAAQAGPGATFEIDDSGKAPKDGRLWRLHPYTGTYYYLAHFSKFARPGAVRLQTKGSAKGVRVMTFQTPQGGFVAELLNSLGQETTVTWLPKGVPCTLRSRRNLLLPLCGSRYPSGAAHTRRRGEQHCRFQFRRLSPWNLAERAKFLDRRSESDAPAGAYLRDTGPNLNLSEATCSVIRRYLAAVR